MGIHKSFDKQANVENKLTVSSMKGGRLIMENNMSWEDNLENIAALIETYEAKIKTYEYRLQAYSDEVVEREKQVVALVNALHYMYKSRKAYQYFKDGYNDFETSIGFIKEAGLNSYDIMYKDPSNVVDD